MPSDRTNREPLKEHITLEICNDCGGLVGWSQYREGCCVGGIVCKNISGTRLIPLSAATARPDWKAEAKRLAEELLEIAEQAMPDSYFESDSRTNHAREVLDKGSTEGDR